MTSGPRSMVRRLEPAGNGAIRRYRGAADYPAVTMIFLRDNVLLRAEHLKPGYLATRERAPGITLALRRPERPCPHLLPGHPAAYPVS